MIKDYIAGTASHAHGANIPKPLAHVTNDYQKLKNSVQRLLKKMMIKFPVTTPVGAKLLAIKNHKTAEAKRIQDGIGDEMTKRSKMTALLTHVKTQILSQDSSSVSHAQSSAHVSRPGMLAHQVLRPRHDP
jgi:hypothetical protein